MSSRLIRMCAFLAAAATLTGGAGAAYAYPDASVGPAAQVDTQIRPKFGVLLRPSTRRHYYLRPCSYRRSCQDGYYGPYRYRGGYNDYSQGGYGQGGYGQGGYDQGQGGYDQGQGQGGYYPPSDGGQYPGQYGTLNAITVDCGSPNAGPAPIAAALNQLADGGVLYLRSRGGACAETVQIYRPVTIVGEGVPAFANGPNPLPATLSPASNNPCFVIDHVKGVEIRDLVMEARGARDRGCIEAFDSDVAVIRSEIRYQGNASAIYVAGGRLVVRHSQIDAKTYDPAILADGVEATFEDVDLHAESVGIDITLGGSSHSSFYDVGLLGEVGGDPNERPEMGLMIHGAREGNPTATIESSSIRGWRTGLWVGRGADVKVTNTRIGRSNVGIVSSGTIFVHHSLVGAGDLGIYISGGVAKLEDTVIHSFGRQALVIEPYANATEEDLWVFASGCKGFREHYWNCRLSNQLPPHYRDDSWHGDRGPWGWNDNSYHSITSPDERRHGFFR